MPFNISRSAQFFDKEILAYPQWGLLARSIVIDATAFAQATGRDERTIVPAGTIMMLSATNAKRYVEYDGNGTIQGILTRQVELLARATASNEPAAMYFHEAVFDSTKIVGFTAYATALADALTTCKFV